MYVSVCVHLTLLYQVEEYGRDMYKLVKTFLSKWKQKKGKDLGGGMKREVVAVGGARRAEEGDEYMPLRMTRTVHEQVKTFKVNLNSVVHVLSL